jgi:phosphoadenosine phosphosulfate reductase
MELEAQVRSWADTYDARHPEEIVRFALGQFPDAAVSFSGAEDVALVEMAARVRPGVRVFTLDTGRLHRETYQFLERVRTRYDVRFEVLFPDAIAVERLVLEKGLYSFLVDGHEECCAIRKVEPLRRALASAPAWLTGQRRDQSPGTRGGLHVVQLDGTFGTPERPLVKWNPLVNWRSADVWGYLREREIPYNALHEHGFVSIGCEPCTRAILPGQHEREGRWWWEEATKKECGLHLGNLPPGT